MINDLKPVIQDIANLAKKDREGIIYNNEAIAALEKRINELRQTNTWLLTRAGQYDMAHSTLVSLKDAE